MPSATNAQPPWHGTRPCQVETGPELCQFATAQQSSLLGLTLP